jgi:hypothetical protein
MAKPACGEPTGSWCKFHCPSPKSLLDSCPPSQRPPVRVAVPWLSGRQPEQWRIMILSVAGLTFRFAYSLPKVTTPRRSATPPSPVVRPEGQQRTCRGIATTWERSPRRLRPPFRPPVWSFTRANYSTSRRPRAPKSMEAWFGAARADGGRLLVDGRA